MASLMLASEILPLPERLRKKVPKRSWRDSNIKRSQRELFITKAGEALSFHHRQRHPPLHLFFFDLAIATAEFANRVRRKNIHNFLAKLGFALEDFFLEGFAFVQQAIQKLRLRHTVGHHFALHVNDP